MGPGPRTAWTQRPMIRARSLSALLGLLLLAGCLPPSKADLIKKAEGANSRNEREAALGEPSEVSKLGPSEKRTYVASEGEVVFVLAGDMVKLGSARVGNTR